MKKTLLSILCLALAFTCCSQSNCSIKRAYSFFKVHLPGNIPVDENGRPRKMPPNIERFIYVEVAGTKMPLVESVLFNNTAFKTNLTRINGSRVVAGKNAANGQDFILTSKKGNTLWKIELQSADENKMVAQGCKNIIIKSKTAGRYCKLYCYKEIELASIPSY